jgi:probable rRNA maturation factor
VHGKQQEEPLRANRMGPGSTGPAFAAGTQADTDVIVQDAAWRRLVPRAGGLARRAALAAGGGSVVVLADDRTVRRLNARDRGRNKPTNVLTYEPPRPGMPGQIILALGELRREAAAMRRRPADHLAHLVVHGMLHLAGHEHDRAGDARRMEMEEARLLHRIGVPNPWKRT